jgi:hypothetical protein
MVLGWNLKMTGNINSMIRPQKTLKKIRRKLYSTVPGLQYGSENWTIKTRTARKITATEMKCVRKTTGYT